MFVMIGFRHNTTIPLCGTPSSALGNPVLNPVQGHRPFPTSVSPSLSVSLHCATFDLNYRLAAALLAALPVCATKWHEICITLIPGPCQLFHISSSRMYERLLKFDERGNANKGRLDISRCAVCPRTWAAFKSGGVLWSCRTEHIHQTACF